MNVLIFVMFQLANPAPVREEPEKIKKWREEQKARLEEKDREEEKKKLELREEAKKELEDWYKHHEESISKTKASNRYNYINKMCGNLVFIPTKQIKFSIRLLDCNLKFHKYSVCCSLTVPIES